MKRQRLTGDVFRARGAYHVVLYFGGQPQPHDELGPFDDRTDARLALERALTLGQASG